MKKFLTFILYSFFVIIAGCGASPHIEKFSGITDMDMVYRSVHKAVDKLRPVRFGIDQDKYIIIQPLEYGSDFDIQEFPVIGKRKLNRLIKNALIEKLLRSGKKVLTRDLNLMSGLFHETEEKFLISISPDAMADDSTMYKNVNFVRHPYKGDDILQDSQELISSDYILAFKAHECGVRNDKKYYEVNDDKLHDKYDQYERKAYTKIFLYLADTKSGEIKWAGYLFDDSENEITLKVYEKLTKEDSYIIRDEFSRQGKYLWNKTSADTAKKVIRKEVILKRQEVDVFEE